MGTVLLGLTVALRARTTPINAGHATRRRIVSPGKPAATAVTATPRSTAASDAKAVAEGSTLRTEAEDRFQRLSRRFAKDHPRSTSAPGTLLGVPCSGLAD